MKRYVGLVVILAAFGFLIATSLNSVAMKSLPVHELRAADSSPHSYVGQRLRVVGFVGKKPVESRPMSTDSGTGTVHHFTVVDKGQTLNVIFQDALPDTFRADGPVQVDGVYSAPGVIEADHVLTKCPSKYEAESKANAQKYGSK